MPIDPLEEARRLLNLSPRLLALALGQPTFIGAHRCKKHGHHRRDVVLGGCASCAPARARERARKERERARKEEKRRGAKPGGPRHHSTRDYKAEALALMARTDLAPRVKDRMLGMLRAECSLFLRANKEGPEPKPEPLIKFRPMDPETLATLRARRGHRRSKAQEASAKGGRTAWPKMQAVLAKRREKAERRAARRAAQVGQL